MRIALALIFTLKGFILLGQTFSSDKLSILPPSENNMQYYFLVKTNSSDPTKQGWHFDTEVSIINIKNNIPIAEAKISATIDLPSDKWGEFAGIPSNIYYFQNISKLVLSFERKEFRYSLLYDLKTARVIDTIKGLAYPQYAFKNNLIVYDLNDLKIIEVKNKFEEGIAAPLPENFFYIFSLFFLEKLNSVITITPNYNGYYLHLSNLTKSNTTTLIDVTDFNAMFVDEKINRLYYFKIRNDKTFLQEYSINNKKHLSSWEIPLPKGCVIKTIRKIDTSKCFIFNLYDTTTHGSKLILRNLDSRMTYNITSSTYSLNSVVINDTIYINNTLINLEGIHFKKIPIKKEYLLSDQYPKIVLKNYSNGSIRTSDRIIKIEGVIVNPYNQIDSLKINNLPAYFSNLDGSFTSILDLRSSPENEFLIETKDLAGNRSSLLVKVIQDQSITAETSFSEIISKTKNYAFIIAQENYQYLKDRLDYPVIQATQLKNILINKYNFYERDIVFKKNIGRKEILDTFDSLKNIVGDKDQFLVYYAGHGDYDSILQKGYWVPIDGQIGKVSNLVSNADVRDYFMLIKAKHILLLSDACFAGSILEGKMRTLGSEEKPDLNFARLFIRKSRQAITSGFIEKVPDESVFSRELILALEKNKNKYLSTTDLFSIIQKQVSERSSASPQLGSVLGTDHQAGEFFFLIK